MSVETFVAIAFYSVLVLAIAGTAASAFVLLGVWLSDVTYDDAGS